MTVCSDDKEVLPESSLSSSQISVGRPRHGQEDEQRAQTMSHLQGHMGRSDGIQRRRFETLLVVSRDRAGIHRRPQSAISQRKIRDRQASVLMAHRRAEDELQQNLPLVRR